MAWWVVFHVVAGVVVAGIVVAGVAARVLVTGAVVADVAASVVDFFAGVVAGIVAEYNMY